MAGDGGIDPIDSARLCEQRIDGPLGRWRLQLWRPAVDLADLIDAIWIGEGQISYQVDRILPTGASHLLINLGPPQLLLAGPPPGQPRRFTDIWFSAPHRCPIDTSAPDGQCLLGIAFQPAGARSWLGIDGDALADQVWPLQDLLGDGAGQLRQDLLQQHNPVQRFLHLEGWLRRRRQPRREAPAALRWALAEIRRRRGQVAIEQLQQQLGCSRNHLAQLFRREVGLSAKALARLARFNAAVQWLSGRDRVPWSELALRCGYFDQSHLIRDFQAFSGLSPGEFIRHARPDSSSIVIR